MKQLLPVIFILFFFCDFSQAAQKATIEVDLSDVYLAPDFDSEIIQSVNRGETFLVSDKTFGPFYRIKLKNGKLGYIPDHEVAINGKPFQERPYVEDELAAQPAKKGKPSPPVDTPEEKEPVKNEIRTKFQGFTIQLINYHEETLGSIQVDNLMAVGYRELDPTFVWEVFGSFNAPKYYADKTNGSVTGVNLWGSYGFNATLPTTKSGGVRYGAALFLHGSRVKVVLPTKSYDLQDLTVGALLEIGYLLPVRKMAFDISAKYFFDKNNYGALGVSLLF